MNRVKNVGRALLLVSLLAILLAGAVGCGRDRGTSGTKVNWWFSWGKAKDQAASEGKPIMINFYTST